MVNARPITFERCDSSHSLQSFSSEIKTKVVLLHYKEGPLSKPILYHLSEKTLSSYYLVESLKDALFNEKDSFISLGNVLSVNKRKKQILLNNGDLVIYDYLVIVSNSPDKTMQENQKTHFALGIQSLINALNLKKKIPADSLKQLSFQTKENKLKNFHLKKESDPARTMLPFEVIVSLGKKAEENPTQDLQNHLNGETVVIY